jgi:hypothetical protein
MNRENQHRSIHEALPLIPEMLVCLLTAANSPAGELTHPQLMADQSEITISNPPIPGMTAESKLTEAQCRQIRGQ